jgi:hypothetical protein
LQLIRDTDAGTNATVIFKENDAAFEAFKALTVNAAIIDGSVVRGQLFNPRHGLESVC